MNGTSVVSDCMASIRGILITRMAELEMDERDLAAAVGVIPREIRALLNGAVEDLDLDTLSGLLFALRLDPEVKVTDDRIVFELHRME